MDRSPRNRSLLAQIPEHNVFKAELAHRFFKIGNDFDRDIAAIGQDRRWSADHKRERARERVTEALRALDEATKPIDAHRRETANLRAGMRMPVYDKGDLAGAALRAELRQLARSMTPGQREMHMVGEHRDEAFIDSLLELKPWCSGFNVFEPNEVALYNAAKESRLADLNGPLMATLEARQQTEAEIAMVANIIRNDVTSAGIDLARAA
jgi:hypothetical protein